MPKLFGSEYTLDQPLYDTVNIPVAATAAQSVTFFTVPQNGVLLSTTLKTYAHTNMVQTGVLEEGQRFVIEGYSWFVREHNLTPARPVYVDYQSLVDGWFEIILGGVNFGYWPNASIPAGAGELGYQSNITAAVTEYHVNHGVPAFSNIAHLKNPIELLPRESLQVKMNWTGAITVATLVTFVLWGTLTRPVR